MISAVQMARVKGCSQTEEEEGEVVPDSIIFVQIILHVSEGHTVGAIRAEDVGGEM